MKQYFNEVTACLNSVKIESLESSLDLILETSRKRSSIFIIGNGGVRLSHLILLLTY